MQNPRGRPIPLGRRHMRVRFNMPPSIQSSSVTFRSSKSPARDDLLKRLIGINSYLIIFTNKQISSVILKLTLNGTHDAEMHLITPLFISICPKDSPDRTYNENFFVLELRTKRIDLCPYLPDFWSGLEMRRSYAVECLISKRSRQLSTCPHPPTNETMILDDSLSNARFKHETTILNGIRYAVDRVSSNSYDSPSSIKAIEKDVEERYSKLALKNEHLSEILCTLQRLSSCDIDKRDANKMNTYTNDNDRKRMIKSRDRLVVKEGSSSSSDDDSLSEGSEASSSQEGPQPTKPKTEIKQGDTVEFPDERKQERERRAAKMKARKKRLTKREQTVKVMAKRDLDRMCMVKPDIVNDREKERALVHTATRGVVQLFNAIAERQRELDKKIAGKSLRNGAKRIATEELRGDSFKRKLEQGQSNVKDEGEEYESKNDIWLSDDDGKKQYSYDSDYNELMDTSEIKTEPESDAD
ncbi:unnamed protein product [Anisakis simplex]|uniref:RRP15-like protein n=1 Tax=Anisakis simplex TaxID=6269 RepID=A0A158PPQ2_ANISI|nr:unnamed protein product [Anisakis simplex]